MREILFRGKQRDNGEWVEGGIVQGVLHELWHNSDRAYITVFPQYLSKLKLVEVDPSTAGQYTGRTDKNGKKIFEGDVLKNIDGICLVSWDEEKSAFVMRLYEYPYETLYLEEMWDDSEIIGNIHDNPELLENP